jgi:transcriptional regulator with PAS, ATPase and Fis domain
MPLHLQAKLLRVLQEKAITRVGSNNTINIDVRIIAATNKNISAMVENNQFREDLFYRLNVVPLVLPSLRERRADIAVLAQYFADEFSVSYQRPGKKLPDDVINRLYAWHWPGNIRELRNVIEYIFVMRGKPLESTPATFPLSTHCGRWQKIHNDCAVRATREGANKQVISSQADSLIKISRFWENFFPQTHRISLFRLFFPPFLALFPVFTEISPTDVSFGPPETGWPG